MKHTKLRKVVAARQFELLSEDRDKTKRVQVLFAKPYRDGDAHSFKCLYFIEGINKGGLRYACGVDGVQALFLAMVNAAAHLYTCDEYKSGLLTHHGDRNLGLPAVSDVFSDVVPEPMLTLVA